MENNDFSEILQNCKTIAVVGLSPSADRPSHEVATYLQRYGYRIVPVNPAAAGTAILGEYCYADLSQAVAGLAHEGRKIDLVDCFRRSEAMPELVQEAAALHLPNLWMQLGVRHEGAAEFARHAKMQVVMDRCLKIEHMRLMHKIM